MERSEVKKSDNPNFANNKSSLQKVGEFLKEARQGRNLSVEDLSSSLKIGKEQLIALEEGDEKSLPEKVFIRAMVRRIAEKLNLDTSFILQELNDKKKNDPKFNPANKKEIQNKEENKKENKNKNKNKRINPIIMIIFSGMLGLICSFILLKYIDKDQKKSINIINSKISLIDSNKNIYF